MKVKIVLLLVSVFVSGIQSGNSSSVPQVSGSAAELIAARRNLTIKIADFDKKNKSNLVEPADRIVLMLAFNKYLEAWENLPEDILKKSGYEHADFVNKQSRRLYDRDGGKRLRRDAALTYRRVLALKKS